MASDDYIRFCPYCKLAYSPDARIYKDPDTYCPRCGNKLAKEVQNGKGFIKTASRITD